MPAPIIFGLKPISLTARTMPTESGGYEQITKTSGLVACTARTIGAKSVVGRRIGAVVDDPQAGLLGVVARAVGGVAGELGVGRHDRDRLRLRILLHGEVDETLGERGLRIRA